MILIENMKSWLKSNNVYYVDFHCYFSFFIKDHVCFEEMHNDEIKYFD